MYPVRISLNKREFFDFVVFFICFKPHFFFFFFKSVLGYFTEYLYVLTGEGNGTPFQYSCLENSMGRGAW